ncbi:MAG TPA: hypothetical protein VNI52_06460 [Sphingobacteriaceae bacterium]|nr:hypothetical protein [Sphingobacteriaceae bacterium]
MISSFKAGAAKVNITPPLGTLINGDFVSHYARLIHDDLFAKALVLQNGEVSTAIIIVDICLMDKTFTDSAKASITQKTGIPANNILISATHTHAAGSVMSVLLGAADLPYRQSLEVLIVQAAVDAYQKLRPAKIGFGSLNAPEHVLCRRYYMKDGFDKPNIISNKQDQVKTNPIGAEHFIERPAGVPDPGLNYLAVQAADGKWISLLANYSLHYVGDWENGTISSDYFGVFASHLQKKLNADADFIGMMSNGTSGDINIWDFQNPDRYPKGHFEKSELIGTDLADKVAGSLDGIRWDANPELAVNYDELAIPVRKPSQTELEAAKQLVKQTDYSKFSITDDGALEKLYAREQILLNEYPDTINMPLQILKIGDSLIGAMAGEFFAETGLKLKSDSPVSNYFTITMANGIFGYVPPAHEIEKGGYESWRCRNSFLENDAEKNIRNKMLTLMKF